MHEEDAISSTDTSHLTKVFEPPLILNTLPDNYYWGLSLVHASVPYSCYNISSVNNTLRYSIDNGSNWNVITIAQGNYSFTNVSVSILSTLEANTHYTTIDGVKLYPFRLYANAATGKSFTNLDTTNWSGGVLVDYSNNNTSTLYLTLGYTLAQMNIDTTATISTNMVDIFPHDSFQIHCNQITNDFIGGNLWREKTIIGGQGFHTSVPLASIEVEPKNEHFFKIQSNRLDRLSVYLTFEDGTVYDTNNERFSVKLLIKPCHWLD